MPTYGRFIFLVLITYFSVMEATKFKEVREQLGLTQAQLADALGVKENTVYRWEAGKLPISKTVWMAVAYLELQKIESNRVVKPTMII